MDVALAGLADEPAVVFAPGVDLAIAEAAHSGHGSQPQTFFFTGQEAVVVVVVVEVVGVGPSHTHASVERSHVGSRYRPRSYKCDRARRKWAGTVGHRVVSCNQRGGRVEC